jgi:hypothetical protein
MKYSSKSQSPGDSEKQPEKQSVLQRSLSPLGGVEPHQAMDGLTDDQKLAVIDDLMAGARARKSKQAGPSLSLAAQSLIDRGLAKDEAEALQLLDEDSMI